MIEKNDPRLQKIEDRIPERWGKYLGISPGWYQIVIDLDEALSEIDPDYEVQQVKTKFGGLRYYCERTTTSDFDGEFKDDPWNILIAEAEAKSYKTCEHCGNPGSMENSLGPWVTTVCTYWDCIKK